MIRLQKYMAHCGVASRRSAEKLIVDGRVSVNGRVVRELGTSIDENADTVLVNGKKISVEKTHRYIALYKPKGYLSTVTDPQGRHTVMELLTDVKERIYPIGRLDYDTEGLLLFTNDGEFANSIMHPKREIEKEYIATVSGLVDEAAIKSLRTGVVIDGKLTAPAKVSVIKRLEKTTVVKIIIHEGRNRQVRKMFEEVGYRVTNLKRVRIGKILASDIKSGTYRNLTQKEIESFKF